MFSVETIQSLSADAARKARQEKKLPFVFGEPEDVEHLGEVGYRLPNFGAYRPKGWKLVDHWLCDKTGWGSENEPALTIRQLKAKIAEHVEKSYGYATIEEGQFQVVLGVFEKQ